MHSNGTYPSPRSGWRGWLDRLTGPGATSAELLLQFVPSVVAGVAAPIHALTLAIDLNCF